MLKESSVADTMFCDFAKLTPSGLTSFTICVFLFVLFWFSFSLFYVGGGVFKVWVVFLQM